MLRLDSELHTIRDGLRSLVFNPYLECARAQHCRIDLVSELAMIIGPQTQWVVFRFVGSPQMGHHGAIGSEADSHHVDWDSGFDPGGGNVYLRFGLPTQYDHY